MLIYALVHEVYFVIYNTLRLKLHIMHCLSWLALSYFLYFQYLILLRRVPSQDKQVSRGPSPYLIILNLKYNFIAPSLRNPQ